MNKNFSKQRAYILLMRGLILQLFLVFSIISFAGVFYTEGQGILQKKISLQVDNMKIKNVLKIIEEHAATRFGYQPQLVDNNRAVTLAVEDTPVLNILNMLFDSSVKFDEVGDMIIFKPAIVVNANEVAVSGKVVDEAGAPMPGVNVLEKGTTNGTVTDVEGAFSLSVENANAVLVVSAIGFLTEEIIIGAQNIINVTLKADTKQLDEVIVVGYSVQRKKDLIGAVSVIKTNDLTTTPSANLTNQLQGRAAGVSVSSSGEPGGAANVRIRGFSSYGNNNPLYIIDGVPTTNAARINPQDIESLQVLKDASSASIYGARAANGVIIITTKQGKSGKTVVSYDSYVGAQSIPFKRIPSLLNSAETAHYLERTTDVGYVDPVYGRHGSFKTPDMYIVSPTFTGGVSADDPRANPDLYSLADYSKAYQIFKTSQGTDWFRAMSQTALIHSHQISASGGSDKSTFSTGLNYFDQDGVFKNTGFSRYTIRVNSTFKPTHYLKFGENIQVAYDNRQGDNTIAGDQTAWAMAYRSAPYIPVYDIKGGYGGSKIGSTAGVGWNPVALLARRKDWTKKNLNFFGNSFLEINLLKNLTAKTSVGVNAVQGTTKKAFLKEYENGESRKVTSLIEGSNAFTGWTWTNTLTYQRTVGKFHDFKILLGSEAIKESARSISVNVSNFDYEGNDFLSLNTGVPKSLGEVKISNPAIEASSLFSYFGRIDYSLKEKYLLSFTLRRDGASLFGASNRHGLFHSLGAAWRMSEEKFIKDLTWIDDLKVRGGWGIMGSISNVPAYNQYSTYSSSADQNFYDIAGQNTGATQGFGPSSQGNANTKWESSQTVNLGLDASFLNGKWSFSLDVYDKNTRDLLTPSLRNGLEPLITKPLINLGTMNNKGVDIQVSNRSKIGEVNYDLGLTFTHYRNKLTKLNDENTAQFVSTRLPNYLITTKGEAISSFYGYQIDGFYNNAEDVEKGHKINNVAGQIGTWKYKDINDDKNITPEDRVILGSPHPVFQTGLNIALSWKNFDFSTFLFWNYGNQLFNYNKYYTYMNVLGGGVARGKLYDAWTPETSSTAKTPALGAGSSSGYTSFVTTNSSSFYVENGSYLRAKTLQLGYTLPKGLLKKGAIGSARVYAQAQNLFTVTQYSGADPDIAFTSGSDGTSGGNSDQNLGVDYSGFPTTRQFLMGLTISF